LQIFTLSLRGVIQMPRIAVAGLHAHLARIAASGHSGVPRAVLSPSLRLVVHGRYNIYFRATAVDTVIVRVLHSARDAARINFDDDAGR
jgi:toxin ParE1/3/4